MRLMPECGRGVFLVSIAIITGAIVATIGLLFIVLKVTIEGVPVRHGKTEAVLPGALFLLVLGIVIIIFVPLLYPTARAPKGDASRSEGSPKSTTPVTTQDPGPDTSTSAAPDPTILPHIKIDPANKFVPRCATFTGTGDAPSGRTLWLAVLTPMGKYYFKPVSANATEHKWTANVILGAAGDPPGAPFMIYAALVDSAINREISQGQFNGEAANLPGGITWIDHIQVARSGTQTECNGAFH
jgi:hypothetical protein